MAEPHNQHRTRAVRRCRAGGRDHEARSRLARLAVAVVRNVVRLMMPADALAVIGHTAKPKPTPTIISIDALIG